jgi:hypothetical protein
MKKKRNEFIEKLLMFNIKQIVFIDESGFEENLIREYVWSAKGEKVIAERRGKKSKRLNIIAGLLN